MVLPADKVAKQTKARAGVILGRLTRRYPSIGTALAYRDPFQLLVATIISAQTTDENVNRVTPELFRRWPTPQTLARARPAEVEAVLYPTGFYHQKTRAAIGVSAALVERFAGVVPSSIEELVSLPGVGRKTASVVLAEAFGEPAIAVDTHVRRLANRLGLSASADPAVIEMDLRSLFQRRRWGGVSMRVIQFGREVCFARRPNCQGCELNDVCPYPAKTPPSPEQKAASPSSLAATKPKAPRPKPASRPR